MDIPSAVTAKVQYLLETEGGDIQYIGDYQGLEAYSYRFPNEMETGFPIIVLYHRGADYAYQAMGDEALDAIMEIMKG